MEQFEMVSYRDNCSHSNMLLEQMGFIGGLL